MKNLTKGAVPSGLNVISLLLLSLNVYVSFFMISDVEPKVFLKTSLSSIIGVWIILNPNCSVERCQ